MVVSPLDPRKDKSKIFLLVNKTAFHFSKVNSITEMDQITVLIRRKYI